MVVDFGFACLRSWHLSAISTMSTCPRRLEDGCQHTLLAESLAETMHVMSFCLQARFGIGSAGGGGGEVVVRCEVGVGRLMLQKRRKRS